MTAPLENEDGIWVFMASSASHSGGVFRSKEIAEAWIVKHGLTGTLTKYPVDQGVYDWATENGYFTAKKEFQFSAEFIGGFTTACQEHYHYGDEKDKSCTNPY